MLKPLKLGVINLDGLKKCESGQKLPENERIGFLISKNEWGRYFEISEI